MICSVTRHDPLRSKKLRMIFASAVIIVLLSGCQDAAKVDLPEPRPSVEDLQQFRPDLSETQQQVQPGNERTFSLPETPSGRAPGSLPVRRQNLDGGNQYLAEGNYAAAISAFREHLRESPDSREAHFNLAVALIQVDRASEAKAHLDWLIQKHPDDPRAYVYRGQLAIQERQWSGSRDDLLAAIEHGADTAQNRAYLALAQLNLRDFPAAKREASLAIEGDPELKDAYFVRCIAGAFLADLEGAKNDLEEAKRLGLEERLVENCEQAIRAASGTSD